jgi:hypothetical protein
MKKLSGQTWFLATVIVASCAAIAYVVLIDAPARNLSAAGPDKRLTLEKIPFDGTQAYEYLQDICALGSRISGSPGMTRQQEILREHFEKQGAKVTMQPFRVRHPANGSAVEMANMVIEWQPDTKQRILIGAHYDTRPRPDQDPIDPNGPFVGANDGASGVALMMQLGESVKKLDGKLGVDFVLFDGEEFIFNDRDEYFLGSTHFAEDYVAHPPKHTYKAGVLLDMVGDKDLEIYQEGNSLDWPASRSVVNSVWAMAKKLGVREFVPRLGPTVNDDHIPLNRKAKIPTCDVIDFEYPHWHTRGDTADKCSALSLAKVGWVMAEWLKSVTR